MALVMPLPAGCLPDRRSLAHTPTASPACARGCGLGRGASQGYGAMRVYRGRERGCLTLTRSRRADKAAKQLVDLAIKDYRKHGDDLGYRRVYGLAGCPGSGKSTLAKMMCRKMNARVHPDDEVAVVVPMDGFHLTRAELDGMFNPKEAHRRRGSHWTFDARGFVDHVASVRAAGSGAQFPSFSHAEGDPVPGGVEVKPSHKIIIVEGLYLYLDSPPWNELDALFDTKWFIACPIGLALHRVINRKVNTFDMSQEEAKRLAHYNDKRNAITVWKTRHKADFLIPT